MIGYIYLFSAILFSTLGNIFMKRSKGFKNFSATILAVISYILVPIFLIMSMQYFEVGITYAIWSGATILTVAVIGIAFFNESNGKVKVIALLLITAGVTCLQLANEI